MKRAIITIAGSLGSGKSSTAKSVAAALSYEHFSSGDMFRQIGAQRGISIEEVSHHRDVDKLVDTTLEEKGKTENNLVIDSRTAWHWIPESFKVFLLLDPSVAAERIFADVQKGIRMSEHQATVEEMRASIDRRFAIEQDKYRKLYDMDPTNPLHFDLIINTKNLDLKTVIAIVLFAYKQWRTEEN